MNAPQIHDPRANQKRRTRNALVEAAARLLRSGVRPTVAEAAEAAMVSRATAYRYFPTQDSLLVEATFTPAIGAIDDLFADDPSTDPEARVVKLVDRFNSIVVDEEASMRTALRAYLDAWFEVRDRSDGGAVREGRRMDWLDAALAPAAGKDSARLKAALALTLGIEPIVVMKDVCRLGDREALAVLQWAARALVRQALAERQAAQPG
jgi:AcrR family transcriptional regulator